MRMIAAMGNVASVRAGMIKCSQVPDPLVGNQRKVTAKIRIAIIPIQKCGIDCPKTAKVRAARSIAEPRVRAAKIPRDKPTTTATRNAVRPNYTVGITRAPITSTTGR